MRTLLIVAAVSTALTAFPVAAQSASRGTFGGGQRMTAPRVPTMGPHVPRVGQWSQPNRVTTAPRPTVTHQVVRNNQQVVGGGQWRGQPGHVRFSQPDRARWGNRIGGRWYAGVDAPGGWSAYRRPVRGWQLPRYWAAPSFTIYDFAGYGLGAPGPGYTWTRYYDDALLIDEGGRVYDSVSGIDWDGGEAGDYASDGYVGDEYGSAAPYAPPPYEDRREGRDDGVGGAIVGGVVGGVAGNVIGGAAGNRLAGTLLGAGAGAIVGAAIDRSEDRDPRGAREDRDVRVVDVRRGRDDRGDGGSGYADDGVERRVTYAPSREIVQRAPHSGGYRTRARAGATTYATGGGTYYAAPGTTTVITIQPSVTTTTTTTEYITDAVTYRPVRKRAQRVKRRTCVCR